MGEIMRLGGYRTILHDEPKQKQSESECGWHIHDVRRLGCHLMHIPGWISTSTIIVKMSTKAFHTQKRTVLSGTFRILPETESFGIINQGVKGEIVYTAGATGG